jgi:hypothetical protein
METTFEPSFPVLRNRIAVIEAIELTILGSVFWGIIALLSAQTPNTSLINLVIFWFFTEAVVLGSWIIYNAYIRIARLGGRFVDVGIWIIASVATGTYTFWAWTILDVNRWILSRLLYRGEAPIEYAWSWRSKRVRKLWEQAQKAIV